jgi:hypothetical protein
MIIRLGCHCAIPWGGLVNRVRGACRQFLARVIVSALIVAVLPAAFLVGSSAAVAAATPDPIVGEWNVTYGAPAVVKMTLAGGEYTETASTPVVVVGSSCSLPAGTVIATFALTGPGTYAGQHGLWFTNDCSFDTWTDMTLSLSSDGNMLTAVLAPTTNYSGSTVIFTKSQHNFTVSGSDSSTTGTTGPTGKQATGSAAQAKFCATLGRQAFKDDEARGRSIAATWNNIGLTTASSLLTHFLNGTGAEVDDPATSHAAAEIEASSEFTTENKAIDAYIGGQLATGATTIRLPAGHNNPVNALGFTNLTEPDLYFALRRTNAIQVSGSGSLVGFNYIGSLTYTISESYGFSVDNVLLGIGTAMRYLQTTCGAPYYPGGAHWFTVSITVKVNFSIPTGG